MIRQLARFRVLVGTGGLFVASAAVMFGVLVPAVEETCGAPALDVRMYSNAAEVRAFLEECGPEGRAAYQQLQLADLGYPAVSAMFFVGVLGALARRAAARRAAARRSRSRVALLPVASMCADYLENVAAWTSLAAFPDTSPLSAALGVCSLVKQMTGWASALVLVALLVALASNRVRESAARR